MKNNLVYWKISLLLRDLQCMKLTKDNLPFRLKLTAHAPAAAN